MQVNVTHAATLSVSFVYSFSPHFCIPLTPSPHTHVCVCHVAAKVANTFYSRLFRLLYWILLEVISVEMLTENLYSFCDCTLLFFQIMCDNQSLALT